MYLRLDRNFFGFIVEELEDAGMTHGKASLLVLRAQTAYNQYKIKIEELLRRRKMATPPIKPPKPNEGPKPTK